MKILLIADREEERLWGDWSERTKETLSDVRLILSAGDLSSAYLEFLVTMLNVPLVYVRGNHDGMYDEKPPEGCIDADGSLVEVECRDGDSMRKLRIMGFGGCMRYKPGASDMYSELEMRMRVHAACMRMRLSDFSAGISGESSFDILLTHAPCRGYGDQEDIPHMGFECFNSLIERCRPKVCCYGHVHQEYGRFKRVRQHPEGAVLINGSGHYILDIDALPQEHTKENSK